MAKRVTLTKKDGEKVYPRTYTKLVQNGDGEILDNIMLTSAKILPFSGYEAGLNDASLEAVAPSGYTINYNRGRNMFFAVVDNVNYSNWGDGEQLLYNRGYSAREDNVYIHSNGNICVIKNGSMTTVSTVGTQLAEVKADIDAFLLDADASSAAIDTLKEIQSYIDSDKESAAAMLASIQANATAITAETERAISEEERIDANLSAESTRAIKAETTLQSNIDAEKERAEAAEQDLEERKTDYNGIYPKFTSGFANNLVGRGEAIEREFVFGQSGGATNSIENEDTARIKSIQGNTLVWNQGINNTVGENGWQILDSAESINIDGSKIIVTLNKKNADNNFNGIAQSVKIVANHKYFIRLNYDMHGMTDGVNTFSLRFSETFSAGNLVYLSNVNSEEYKCIYIPKKYYNYIVLVPRQYGATELPTEYVEYDNVLLYDLTQMFGAGNEPTTAEEAEKLINELNVSDGYNAGQLINNNTTAIKTVGFNAWDEKWAKGTFINGNPVSNSNCLRSVNSIKVLPNTTYYFKNPFQEFHVFRYDKNYKFLGISYNIQNKTFTIPQDCEYIQFSMGSDAMPYREGYRNDICINLSNTGYKNGTYKPYVDFTRQLPTVEGGLKSAGTVQDEIAYNISNKKWEFNKRVGNVDLGSLTWEASTEYANTFSAILADARIYEATSDMQNLRCAPYITTSRDDQTTNATNKSISANLVDTAKRIYIVDTDYTDAEALKTALAGKELYYELANYIVTELDTDISPDYKAWDWGTEEAMQTIPSAPFKAKIAYGFNAVDQIRGNKLNIDDLLSRVAALEAQLAQTTNTTENIEENETVVE